MKENEETNQSLESVVQRTEQALAIALRPALGGFAVFFVCLNFLFIFCRFQEVIPILGTIRLPLVITLLTVVITISKFRAGYSKQLGLILFFLAVEACRNLVGKLIVDDFVRNDQWAFQCWYNIVFFVLAVVAPLGAMCGTYNGLKTLSKVWLFVGLYLGLFSLTHGGKGPGGIVGDENDLAYAILVFFPLGMFLLSEKMGVKPVSRIITFLIVLVSLGGIIASFSRGGFLGLLVVSLGFFVYSRRKVMLAVLGIIFTLALIPAISNEYINEMRSITKVNEGTAATRLHFWDVGLRVFKDPRNTLTGVGMGNLKYRLADYETSADTRDGPSIGGRAVHSVYVDILGDLGIWGVLVIGTLIGRSILWNTRTSKLSERLLKQIAIHAPMKLSSSEKEQSASEEHKRNLLWRNAQRSSEMMAVFALALNISILAFLSAGAFVSVLYYPQIWIIIGLSGSLYKHQVNLVRISENLFDKIEPESKDK